ncbi:MAG: NAD(P)H-dependent oxidoreductase [Bacteroidales bacterium]|nr:NAD(P)H-dependent oxidoreductase [Bacteroidales bacterium]
MKTLVLNTLGKEALDQVNALIKDKEVEVVDTSDMKIAHCMGCNQCWLKTPGICAINDDYEKIIKKLVETEILWIVSDTRFGFLDYKGKRVMDRIMPMLNMTIGFRDGWMRHELRYHPLNVGLLYKGPADQMMMEDWCNRTAANIGGRSLGAIDIDYNAKQVVDAMEEKPVVAGRPEHLVIINGSPRVAKFSNTDKIIHSFVKGLEEEGVTWELHNLSDRKLWDAARDAFLRHGRILIAFPLYVECVPSLMLEFLSILPTGRQVPCQLSFLLHGGMDEGNEFRLAQRFLQGLPAQLGCSYGGTLIKGGSFRIRTTTGEERAKMVAPWVPMGKLFAQKGSFLTPEAERFIGPEQYPWWVRKMVSLLFLKKVNRGFEGFAKSLGCTRRLDDKPYSR